MGLFGFGRKKTGVIDFSERYRKQQENVAQDNLERGTSGEISESSDDKKKKLVKRLIEMTNRVEDLSNQIYHLQQRVELLERKAGVSGFE